MDKETVITIRRATRMPKKDLVRPPTDNTKYGDAFDSFEEFHKALTKFCIFDKSKALSVVWDTQSVEFANKSFQIRNCLGLKIL